jgi:hypothetical protein
MSGRRIVAFVAAFAVIAAVAFVTWDRSWRKAGSSNPGFTCPAVVAAHHRLPLSAIGVHRVALIGDSIMDQASCALAEGLASEGIRTTRHAVSGSGLLAGMDWVTTTRQILAAEHPDVVVAIFVGNYLPGPITDAHGNLVADDSPAFFAAWQQRAEELSRAVHAAGARMYWVSPPPITNPVLAHAARLFRGYRKIAGDHVLMSGEVLSGPHGTVEMTKDTCGHRRVVRTSDGVHLTADGARIYGQQIAHDLTIHFGVFTAPRPC